MKKLQLLTTALASPAILRTVTFDGTNLVFPTFNMNDAATMAFVQSELTHVENQVYEIQYPDIQYPELIFVDQTAPDWVQTVTFTSIDHVGQAKFISHKGDDIPYVSMNRNQYQSEVYLSGIGYEYTVQEVAQAQYLGISLPSQDAMMARRAYEEFIDEGLLTGHSEKGMNGLINYPGITTVAAPNGASASPLWENKTADEVLLDINNALSGVWIDSRTVEIADTLLLSEQSFVQLANKRVPGTATTLMAYVMANNVLTLRTGRPLTIKTVRGLETAGAGSTSRMVAYRNDPTVLKAHLPMPLQFMDVQIVNLAYKVPGMFRFGGLDIRLPGSVRYVDGI